MRCDYHVHSSISCDCQAPMEEQLERAVEVGLDEICFTEHLEMNFHRGNDWHTDINKYKNKINGLNEQRLQVKFGIEAGITCGDKDFDELKAEIERADFDFVLACAHAVNDADPFMPVFFQGKSRKQVFEDYFEALLTGLEKLEPEYYSAVAHIDFPAKGMHALGMPNAFLKYDDAPDQIDELFRKVISLGKCIEINTSTFRNTGFKAYGPKHWLRRYAELGGEFVTFGSDAHHVERVGYAIPEAMEWARQCGVRYFATYKHMEPTLHRLCPKE